MQQWRHEQHDWHQPYRFQPWRHRIFFAVSKLDFLVFFQIFVCARQRYKSCVQLLKDNAIVEHKLSEWLLHLETWKASWRHLFQPHWIGTGSGRRRIEVSTASTAFDFAHPWQPTEGGGAILWRLCVTNELRWSTKLRQISWKTSHVELHGILVKKQHFLCERNLKEFVFLRRFKFTDFYNTTFWCRSNAFLWQNFFWKEIRRQ